METLWGNWPSRAYVPPTMRVFGRETESTEVADGARSSDSADTETVTRNKAKISLLGLMVVDLLNGKFFFSEARFVEAIGMCLRLK